MPIIKSAKKKVKQDKVRSKTNSKYESAYKRVIGTFKRTGGKGKDALKELHSAIDKAAKKGVIHKKKANRLKSNLSKSHASRKKST